MRRSQPGKGLSNVQRLSCVTMYINNHNTRQKVINKWQSRGKKWLSEEIHYWEFYEVSFVETALWKWRHLKQPEGFRGQVQTCSGARGLFAFSAFYAVPCTQWHSALFAVMMVMIMMMMVIPRFFS